MSGFSADWLRLREPVDHRSRDQRLLARAAELVAALAEPVIYDLGAGAGSNLRGTAPALGSRQRWVLVDYDPTLLSASLDFIGDWAEQTRATPAGLEAAFKGKAIRVELKRADLAADPAPWGSQRPDLVTSAALFDLVSAEWIERFCAALARQRIPLYTTLVHNAVARWSPPHEADGAMVAAFETHFGTDKGFGPSAGNHAVGIITNCLRDFGYVVETAESPWRLEQQDAAMIAALAEGWADAVRQTGSVSESAIESWLAARKTAQTGCVVGHMDLLAIPR
jgi:hypothetical protein